MRWYFHVSYKSVYNNATCDLRTSCYVAGGVQLQNFRSLGRQTHARADALLLQHGTELHVTVVAENAAGLKTVIYSDARTIDLTAPQLCCLVVSILPTII